MQFLDTKRQRAALLIFVLGLGLAYALWPFITGLMGALVLVRRVHARSSGRSAGTGSSRGWRRRSSSWPRWCWSSGPASRSSAWWPTRRRRWRSGVLQSPLLGRLRELRLGPYDIGAQIEALGSQFVSWAGSSALSVVGTATRIGIQLTIAFFGLFYLLVAPAGAWRGIRPFIPFSSANAEVLRVRFRDVTFSTLDRHRADGGGAGTAGRRRVLGGGPGQRRLLGGSDHHRGHPAGGGKRARSGARVPRRWRSRDGTGGPSR